MEMSTEEVREKFSDFVVNYDSVDDLSDDQIRRIYAIIREGNAMDGTLYDVVIYEIESQRVEAIVGKEMTLDSGHYNSRKRVDTALDRINEHFSVAIVPHGTLKKGDVLKGEIE